MTRDVVAFHAQWQQSSETPIYLDGRSHPPDFAPYSWMGFSTAVWEGATLKITTTHIKEDRKQPDAKGWNPTPCSAR